VLSSSGGLAGVGRSKSSPAGPADQSARGLGSQLPSAEVGERRGQRIVHGDGLSVLSEMFPELLKFAMTSCTACDFVNCFVDRIFRTELTRSEIDDSSDVSPRHA
jgi:hypothetical protein